MFADDSKFSKNKCNYLDTPKSSQPSSQPSCNTIGGMGNKYVMHFNESKCVDHAHMTLSVHLLNITLRILTQQAFLSCIVTPDSKPLNNTFNAHVQ